MMISNWKNDLLLPDAAIKQAGDADTKLYAEFYAMYQKHMKAYNALDFDDLILIQPYYYVTTQKFVRGGSKKFNICWSMNTKIPMLANMNW